jgi:hypothetical protein
MEQQSPNGERRGASTRSLKVSGPCHFRGFIDQKFEAIAQLSRRL